MEDSNNQDDTIEEEDIDIIEDRSYHLDKNTFEGLRKNNPVITHLRIQLNVPSNNEPECYFNNIDWKKEGDDCIIKNTHLKKILIFHIKGYGDPEYSVLGEEADNLPTRQQLQDFFSCIYRNSSIKVLSFCSIQIIDEFGGGLIEGLGGHPSLTKLEIGHHGSLGSIACNALGKVLKHSQSKLKDLHIRGYLDSEGVRIICDALLGNSTIKKLSLMNREVTSVGWRALSSLIQHPNCKLVDLALRYAGINDDGANLLGSALIGSSLKVLDFGSNHSVSSAGWQTLFNQLSSTSVGSLDLKSNNINDEGLVILANIGTLKSLDLVNNRSITPIGWQSFFNILQRRGTQLKKLDISSNIIGNEGIAALRSSLVNMGTLKELETHTLCDICYDQFDGKRLPDDLVSSLKLNRNKDKVEVTRQKILQTHFSGGDASKMQEILDMELEMMPSVVEWIGRPTQENWCGTNMSGLSLMYNLIPRAPDLFDSSDQKKLAATKRKRCN